MTGSYVADTHLLMTGPDELQTAIGTFLEANLPPLIDVARAQLNITDEWMLPYPVSYAVDDPYMTSNEFYPAVGLVIVNDNDNIRTDTSDAMESEYWVRYSCRFPIVCLSPRDDNGDLTEQPRQDAIKIMKRLTACFKALVLDRPSFGDTQNVELIESSMTTDYIEAFQVKSESSVWLSQSIISVDIKFRQWTYNPPYGTPGNNNQVNVTTQKLVP